MLIALRIVVGEDEVPAIAAVLAPVGDDVAGLPDAVLGGMGQEEAAAAAVDADDLGFGCHPDQCARGRARRVGVAGVAGPGRGLVRGG